MRILLNLLFCLFLLSSTAVVAQTDVQTLYALARQAKDNGENEKAIGYFEELFQKTNSDTYYNELVQLYASTGDFSTADKLIKKRIKQLPGRPELYIDRGYIAELQGESKTAERYYDEAVSQVDENSQKVRLIANKFYQYKNFPYVEKTYLKARKEGRNDKLFRFELANAYAQLGKTEEMIEEYLSILEGNRGYIQTVQNIFQRILHPDPDGSQMESLRTQLLRRIQSQPNQDIFSELLIWLYIQDKNFTGAFIQAKALDKRASEQGKRLYALGELSLSNNEFDVARQSYEYIISLGENAPYYLNARRKLVEVLRASIIHSSDYTQEDLQNLNKAYKETLTDLGRGPYTLSLQRGWAELYAYYLDSVEVAVSILEKAIALNGISKQEKAETKIELADLMLLKGEIWEASLLYSQVEKEFKYDRLGETAKFKNAKIAFYTGDFFWAQAQLNVLKGSTSKLIANDALDLSLLITDNVGLDSIIEPLQMYARADLLFFKKDYEAARKTLDSIPKFFPQTSLKDDILFTQYKLYYEERDFEQAAEQLRKLLADYAEDILGDDALFSLAKLEEEKFGNKEKAMELYKTLLTTYPSSLFVVESRKRFRNLRGDRLEEEIN
jgi:tetratricopeptide (TPR) repeat protein